MAGKSFGVGFSSERKRVLLVNLQLDINTVVFPFIIHHETISHQWQLECCVILWRFFSSFAHFDRFEVTIYGMYDSIWHTHLYTVEIYERTNEKREITTILELQWLFQSLVGVQTMLRVCIFVLFCLIQFYWLLLEYI